MLAISIAESLQGPAALSEWDYSDADALAAADAWQQWGLEGQDRALAMGSFQDAWKMGSFNPALWGPWPTDGGFQSWQGESELAELAMQEAAASLALQAAAMVSCKAGTAAAMHMAVEAPRLKEAAWASPLRVPLPAPLAMEPCSNIELGSEFEALELPVENVFEQPQRIATPPGLLENVFEQPQKIATPPGLLMHSGPGAVLTAATLHRPKPLVPAGAADHAPPGIVISPGEVGGRVCSHVEWKIDDFKGKLQASMGRPVVSPAFAASGLSNLRLMVFPDARDIVKSARSHERKGLYSAMVKKGPLYGSLKLKADGLEHATIMTFSLVVGSTRMGPIIYDFSEQAVQGVEDFGVNWLEEIEKASGALRVGIEIIEVRRK